MNPITDLNPAQREAVQCTEGPLLVLAGAGSGKTRVLTCRIAHLIDAAGVPPWNILAVTFTNKAAGEMRERIEGLVGSDSAGIWMGTFHSVCVRILRYESQAFGLDSSFTIYDEEDRRLMIRKILADLEVDEQELSWRAAAARISRAKNGMADAEALRGQITSSSPPQNRITADVFERYQAELRQNNAFDFDDLICEPVRRFQQFPEVLEKYRNRFRYILIDEYQDTNRPQYLLSRLLAREHRNICCVGDDDQSIYQFRGADIRNILDFERDYPEATVVRLEQNYRSTKRILEAANAVIQNNLDRKGKNLWTQADQGDPLRVGDCGDDRTEARHIVAAITETCRTEGLSLSEAAVLYRTNAQSRALEEELQRGGIPYVVVGGIRFYERREIKDLLAYFRLLANPADDVSLLRIINVPKRGIGAATVERLREFATRHRIGLLQAVVEEETIPGLSARAANCLERFAGTLRGLRREYERLELPELAEQVLVRAGYLDALRDDPSVEARSREENIDQLLARIAEFHESGPAESTGSERPGLEGFLEEVALMSPVDRGRDRGGFRHPDDPAHGQGARVPPDRDRRHGGRAITDGAGHRGEPQWWGRDRRGAPPVLRRHHPGAALSDADLRALALLLRLPQPNRALPVSRGDSAEPGRGGEGFARRRDRFRRRAKTRRRRPQAGLHADTALSCPGTQGGREKRHPL